MPNRRDPNTRGRGPRTEPEGSDLPPDGKGPANRNDLPWELPSTFLGLDERASAFETAKAIILPVPYEATTSYGGGTRAAPAAIVASSRYIELYDQELDRNPSLVGIHTLPAFELSRGGPAAAAAELETAFGHVLDQAGDRFVVTLGGEHAISAPLIRATAQRQQERVTVLQLDAHADLRASFEGTEHSHASAMARVLDCAHVVGLGIRGISEEEVAVARGSSAVSLIYADEMWADDSWMDRAMDLLVGPIYLTFDVDFFDPSMMPSTGTPEPGGGDWYRTLRFLRRVFSERKVIGCDVVELAPIPGVHAPDFLVAKLVYKMIGYRFFA